MIAPNIATLCVLSRSDEQIAEAARTHGLALTVAELRRIAERLERDPTLVEAHAFDAQWSEHCSYKSTRAFLSRLPTEGPNVVLGPGEDAGIVHLGEWQGERYGIVVAHESHNHPSQVVPFEGAATGIGGIVRDVLCMGARVIAVADPLRFGPLDDPHCRYVAQGVVDGIAAYGNAIGVPNIGGSVYFHEGFRDNCLVNVIALGLVKERDIIHSRAPAHADGWDIVLVGKATDRSGFGGASFSSLVLDEDDAEANKGAVQVPDPFLKNVLMRASYHAFDVIAEERITVGFKDLGAGGIMGCTAELVAAGGFGATIDLDRCPTSQPNLLPEVIAVGETQERLAWVVPPHFTPRLLAIYNDQYGLPEIAQGAQAAVVGTVQRERNYVLRWHGEEVMRVPIDFLTDSIRYERPYEPPQTRSDPPPDWPMHRGIGSFSEELMRVRAACTDPNHMSRLVNEDRSNTIRAVSKRILSHRDVCSRSRIYERYDSVVRGITSVPAGEADAGVIVPIPGCPRAVALGIGGNARYGSINARRAAEYAVCEAVRNVVAVGARPTALTDCLNFGNPQDPKQFGQFVASIEGIRRAARELQLPFVSGNVSLYNQSAEGNAVPPSPVVACLGILADISNVVTPRFKKVGSPLYRLGGAIRSYHFAGSAFAEVTGLMDYPLPPQVSYVALRRETSALLDAIEAGLVLAVHDISDGGLLVTLAEMAFPTLSQSPIGVSFDGEPDASVFSEMGGYVVEVSDEDAFEDLCEDRALHNGGRTLELPLSVHWETVDGQDEPGWFSRIGDTVDGAAFVFARSEKMPLQELYEAWSAPLRDFYGDAA